MLKFSDLEAKWEAKLRLVPATCTQRRAHNLLIRACEKKNHACMHGYTPRPRLLSLFMLHVICRSRGAKALENGTEGGELTEEERDELTGSGRGIFMLIFLTVVREGVETAVFIGGVGASNWRSLPLPAFVGIILGLLVGFVIVRGGRRVSNSNLKWFFYASSVFLFFVAAGFTNYSADEIESIFADKAQKNGDLIIGEPLWDLRYCCHETQNGFFAIFRYMPPLACVYMECSVNNVPCVAKLASFCASRTFSHTLHQRRLILLLAHHDAK